jgi:hypothetical protein
LNLRNAVGLLAQPMSAQEGIFMNYMSNQFKHSSLCEDELVSYFGKIVTIQVSGYSRTIAGEVVGLSEKYLTLRHRDGRETRIKRRDVSFISEIPVQRGA